MATPTWQVSGQYYETCSCDFVCPCLPGGMAVRPTRGSCTFAMAFEVSRGTYGTVPLDGLGFIVLGFTPEAMANGNWSVGLIADERATAEQGEAITAIASGAAGGPMAALSGLIGRSWACSRHQFASIAAARSGPSRRRISLTWLPRREGTQPRRHRADAPRQHGPSGRGSLRVGARCQQPRACPRPGLGRRKRQEQRAVRAVFLAQRVARHCAARPRLHHHRESSSPSMPGPPLLPSVRPPSSNGRCGTTARPMWSS